jgi:hypothetical protein
MMGLYVPKEDAQKAEELLKEFERIAVENAEEEIPNEMETADEEPVKSTIWQFPGKIRLFYVRISWLFFGIVWLLFGIFLTTIEKKYFHGPALIALGAFIILYVIYKCSHSNRRRFRGQSNFYGTASVYNPMAKGFELYLRYPFPINKSDMPDYANRNLWHLNWVGIELKN